MKKKWIKDLTSNGVIHATTEEIANKLCKKFDELGLKWSEKERYNLARLGAMRAHTLKSNILELMQYHPSNNLNK